MITRGKSISRLGGIPIFISCNYVCFLRISIQVLNPVPLHDDFFRNHIWNVCFLNYICFNSVKTLKRLTWKVALRNEIHRNLTLYIYIFFYKNYILPTLICTRKTSPLSWIFLSYIFEYQVNFFWLETIKRWKYFAIICVFWSVFQYVKWPTVQVKESELILSLINKLSLWSEVGAKLELSRWNCSPALAVDSSVFH